MDSRRGVNRPGALLAAVTLAALALAWRLFPLALPIIALDQRLTRDLAVQRADSFFAAHRLAPQSARTTVRFRGNDSLATFVELEGGGTDTLDALVRGRDIALFTWSVRAFVPGDPHEARVHFAPDGRVVGFMRAFAEADARPTLTGDSARALAEEVLAGWLGETPERWRFTTSSYETRKASGRVDRTLTFERHDRRVGGAPLRLDIVIAGDSPSSASAYVVIPETFRRRYGEMRSANQILSLSAGAGMLAFAVAGAFALRGYSRRRLVRWRGALLLGGVIGALLVAAGLNEIPTSWYDYDTATSPAVFELTILAGALFVGALTAVLVGLTLAAAEAAERDAFPAHPDWWKLWKYRGTGTVAGRVLGGYTVAAIGFVYVALFYLLTRRLFGWWVPSELLDDPNQIATPMPWIAAISVSLQAGVWEEALFRALPLSLLSLWVGRRPRRTAWMAAGVVVTALVFGFAHASYPSWPPYSRGVEIFLQACVWGALFVRLGLIVTVVAHFVYDLTLFGLFAAAGNAMEYRLTLAVIVLALLAPALAVAWRWARQRALTAAPDDARFAAWEPGARVAAEEAPPGRPARVLSARSRACAVATVAAGALFSVLAPLTPVRGPRFTITRARAIALGDSVLRTRGVDPGAWKRLARTATDTLDAWPRFLRENGTARLASSLAASYATPAWWVVRYVRTVDSLSARAEEWRVRVRPDGTPLDVRHIVPESAPGDSLTVPVVRRLARAALAHAQLDTTPLYEVKYDEVARPHRRDVTVVYGDSATPLPGGAAARVFVSLAGREPVLVRREVELPERFLRDDRDRQQRRLAVSALCALALAAALVIGAFFVTRRHRPLVDDSVGRRAATGLVLALVLFQVAESFNGLPLLLFSYNTATPWRTFVTSTGLGVAFGAVAALLIAALWLPLNALRRRAGIPLVPSEPGEGARDALTAGLALGGLAALLARAVPLAAANAIPDPPDTMLDAAFPAVSDVLSAPIFVALIVPVCAIPALAIGGLARRWRWRIPLIAAFLALAGGAGAAAAANRLAQPSALVALLGLAIPVAVVLGIRAWGTFCAAAWIIAALTERALSAARFALHAPTSAERMAGLVSVLGVLALLGLLARRLAPTNARANLNAR